MTTEQTPVSKKYCSICDPDKNKWGEHLFACSCGEQFTFPQPEKTPVEMARELGQLYLDNTGPSQAREIVCNMISQYEAALRQTEGAPVGDAKALKDKILWSMDILESAAQTCNGVSMFHRMRDLMQEVFVFMGHQALTNPIENTPMISKVEVIEAPKVKVSDMPKEERQKYCAHVVFELNGVVEPKCAKCGFDTSAIESDPGVEDKPCDCYGCITQRKKCVHEK